MKPPLQMTAAEITEALTRHAGFYGPPRGCDGPTPNGCTAMIHVDDIADLIRRGHFVVLHRDYITRIVELLETSQ